MRLPGVAIGDGRSVAIPAVPMVLGIIAAATVARLAIAATATSGVSDLLDWRILAEYLRTHGLRDFYVNFQIGWYDYPPPFLLWFRFADTVARATGIDFAVWVRLPAIAADAAIAWLVQDYLARRGARTARRLAATLVVSLGPIFFLVSAYTTQFDAVAILPAVWALWLWRGADTSLRRLIVVAVLIGIGGTLKTVPVVMALALLPTCRNWTQRLALLGISGGIYVLAWSPILVADVGVVRERLAYAGFPGVGGLSLVVQPGLAEYWLGAGTVSPSRATEFLLRYGGVLRLATLLAATGILMYRRTAADRSAVVLWLAVYVFGGNFFIQYAIWGLPFFVMTGQLFWAAAFQAVLLLPTGILLYDGAFSPPVNFYHRAAAPFSHVAVYVTNMIAVWLLLLVAFLRSLPLRLPQKARHG